MSLGVGELIVLGFVVVVVFSAARMGALGNALGKFVYAFKKASRGQGFIDLKSGTLKRSPPSHRSGGEPEDAELVRPEEPSATKPPRKP